MGPSEDESLLEEQWEGFLPVSQSAVWLEAMKGAVTKAESSPVPDHVGILMDDFLPPVLWEDFCDSIVAKYTKMERGGKKKRISCRQRAYTNKTFMLKISFELLKSTELLTILIENKC